MGLKSKYYVLKCEVIVSGDGKVPGQYTVANILPVTQVIAILR